MQPHGCEPPWLLATAALVNIDSGDKDRSGKMFMSDLGLILPSEVSRLSGWFLGRVSSCSSISRDKDLRRPRYIRRPHTGCPRLHQRDWPVEDPHREGDRSRYTLLHFCTLLFPDDFSHFLPLRMHPIESISFLISTCFVPHRMLLVSFSQD